ncbi:MAG: Hsp70 family protein [Deltaproteobacteria bacterium]|nr:Hsp70 family protein [Deltaproteobacteria bacterium]
MRVAIVAGGAPLLVEQDSGGRPVPAVVALEDSGALVGEAALRRAASLPAATVRGVKRLLAAGPLRMGVLAIEPEQVAGLLIAHAAQMATGRLGQRPAAVVMCAPAWFSEAQRDALVKAASYAGIAVTRLVLEPTAAALTLAGDETAGRTVAVVDIGAGGTSAAVLQLGRRAVALLGAAGDGQGGGDAVDEALTRLGAQALGERTRGALADTARQELLRQSCEEMKRELSAMDSTRARLSYLPADPDGAPASLTLTREGLGQALEGLLVRVESCCNAALVSSGVTRPSLQAVFVTGGMTRIPAVRACVEAALGRRVQAGLHPSGAVALGAAMLAGALAREGPAFEVDETRFAMPPHVVTKPRPERAEWQPPARPELEPSPRTVRMPEPQPAPAPPAVAAPVAPAPTPSRPAQAPLGGYNNSFRHRGHDFHVQTEDSGADRPWVTTHLFMDGGQIIKTTRTSYAEHLDREDLVDQVRELMRGQHKTMALALRDGEIDALIEGTAEAPVAPSPAPAPANEAIAGTDFEAQMALLEQAAHAAENMFWQEIQTPVPPDGPPAPSGFGARFVSARPLDQVMLEFLERSAGK